MSNNLSANLLAQMFGQVSDDPFLMLVTISHSGFTNLYLVNNTVNQTSRGQEYQAFPMEIRLPTDDGEQQRQVEIIFDNVSLELITELRSITDELDVKIEMVLASSPDSVLYDIDDLKLKNITYDKQKISGKLIMDSFLGISMTSEQYVPLVYPGLF